MSTKIALISDSHSYIDHKTLQHLEEVDEIWHAGDIGELTVMNALPEGKTIRAVYGNIDDTNTQNLYPEWLEWEVEDVRFLMTHIGGKPPRYAKQKSLFEGRFRGMVFKPSLKPPLYFPK